MKHIYNFNGFAGYMNCSDCDTDTAVNEYNRGDGLVVQFCKKCEDRLHL
jgi:NAD-dependent SIR2 family protein deacetylase